MYLQDWVGGTTQARNALISATLCSLTRRQGPQVPLDSLGDEFAKYDTLMKELKIKPNQ